MKIQFTEDCLIGIEQIDAEHRYLFELLAKADQLLHDVSLADRYEEVKGVLRELEVYAKTHFAHEEAYMEKIRDPELFRQRTQHSFFCEKLCEWELANINEEEEQQKMLEDILSFLVKWLYHHIIGSDIMIGKLPPVEEWMIKENPCEFSEDYLTGIELVDEEHRELFRIVNEANELVRHKLTEYDYDKVASVMQQLKKYTIEHFHDEEEYMEQIHYEGLEAQKRAHDSFIEKLDSVNLEQVENLQEYMEELIEFLLGWLINHILYADKKIPEK